MRKLITVLANRISEEDTKGHFDKYSDMLLYVSDNIIPTCASDGDL
jgi:hypothetical protein